MIGLIDNHIDMIAHLTRLIFLIMVSILLACPPATAEDVDVYDDHYRLQYRIRGDKVYDRDYRQRYRIGMVSFMTGSDKYPKNPSHL